MVNLKKSISIKKLFFVYKILGIADVENNQLATISYHLKHLTSLTPRPNIVLNAVKFYSACIVIDIRTLLSRIMTLVL